MSEPQATSIHDAETIDRRIVNRALTSVLAASLRPVCVGLALFYALLTVWYWFELEGEARTTMSLSTALLSIGLVVGAVWFERNRIAPRFAHPAAAVIGVAAITNALLLLVSVPLAHQTTNLMIVQLGFGCLMFSVRWFAGLALLSWLGWAFVAGARTTDPEWHHFGMALVQATLFGALVLVVRIRAYRETQELRLRDQVLVRQLKEANQAALVAVKAKSEFLANMSHEIRTPMTAMLGMTELLQMSELNEEQREYASTIDRAGNTLLQLVNDILDFSKIEAGHLALEKVTFNLRDMLDEVHELLAVKARQKKLELSVQIDPEAPLRYVGDPTRLKQILVNLVGNAIKFTHEGHVRLSASARTLDAGDAILELAVQDSGIGIPDDKLDQIFDAFTQADASTTRKYGGTGLGLAISRQLTRLLGGDLHVESTVGQGSTFTVSLALPLVQHRTSIPAPAELSAMARYEGRILLVEDNPDNQSLAEELLMRMGCAVEHASNGMEALDRLAQESYDLVLMDCHMPNMNGYDATKEIRRREADKGGEKHVPIVALTASVLPEERARCKEVGMDDYIAKPFSRSDLQQVLDRYL